MKCWYCEEELMQKAPDLGEGWFRCANCKATWAKPVKASHFKIVDEKLNPMTGKMEPTPSDSVLREAKKSREARK